MSLGLQCLLLLAISSSLLALPVYKTRRGDNFERSFGSRVSRDAETSNTKGEENEFLFEGDIKLEDGYNPYADQIVKREAGGSGDGVEVEVEPSAVPNEKAFQLRDDLWVEGKVPYKFETSLSPMYRDIFIEAMKWWSNATGGCVSFHHASQNDQDFLLYRKDNGGCSSFVGRRGGEQYLNISSTCSGVGNAAHEIGHALGLWHEHSRPDRDLYINVLTDNIKSQKIADNNFGLLSQKTFSKVPPVTYDIESIMHYGAYAFTNDQTKKTIEVRDGADWDMCDNPEEMGQRERISHKDTLRIKMLYGCGVVTPMDMPQSCETTTPTPTPTTPLASTPTPTPTATIRLISNNVITLQFFAGPINDKNELTKYGVRCVPSPGCTPTPCISLGGTDGHCSVAKNEFRIIRPGDAKIRAGDKVLLRSVHKSSMWLNCSSGINNECNISPCTSNAADPSNSSYISECKDHFFIIEGIGRKSGKILSTKHQIQFKSYENNKYLNCEDKKCRLIEANECPATDSNENNCDTGIQSYNITKIREY